MGVVANSGPYISYGITQTSTGQVTEYNEERGPDISDLGSGLMDPRPFYRYSPGSAVGTHVLSLFNSEGYVDFVPTSISSNGLLSNGTSSASGTLTLTATGAGVTTTSVIAPESGATITGLILLGSTVAGSTIPYIQYGQSGTVCSWNPQFGTGRNISIACSSNLDSGNFTVLGRDMYGFKMSETLAAGSTTITGKKAFKYISSITASTTITSTGFLIGYGDIYGFPLKLPYCGINSIVQVLASAYSSAVPVLMSSVTVVLASTVATQTSTTPDVRGTYASTTASNGTVRFQIYQGVDPVMMGNITASDTSALFGATQYSSV
jgi:hypothetical protein